MYKNFPQPDLVAKPSQCIEWKKLGWIFAVIETTCPRCLRIETTRKKFKHLFLCPSSLARLCQLQCSRQAGWKRHQPKMHRYEEMKADMKKKTSIKFEQTLKQPERTITNLETLENKYVAKAILRLFSKFLDNRRTFSWQPSFGLSLRQRDASRRTPDISVKANRWRWRKQSPHHFWAEHGACTHTVSQKQASHGCKLIDLTQPRLPCASLGTVESQVSMVWFCL